MRGIRLAGAIVLLFIGFAAGALAASNVEKIEAFLRHDFQVVINGDKANTDPVLVYKGRSYLPLAQVSEWLGVDVIWDEPTKTIHVNTRYSGQPGEPVAVDEPITDLELLYPYGYEMRLDRGTYEVLGNYAFDGTFYYREKDIQYAGIDTRGARKVRDTVTKQIYISDAELRALYSGDINFVQKFGPVVTGEYQTIKVNALLDYMQELPEIKRMMFDNENQYTYYPVPYVISIDYLGNDKYEVLATEENKFILYTITLTVDEEGDWRTGGFNTKLLSEREYW